MKFTKYFMPFAALALLASCSDDNIATPDNGGREEVSGESVYMKLNIAANLQTRTSTGEDEEVEDGQPQENAVVDALVIFTDASGNVLTSTLFTAMSETQGAAGDGEQWGNEEPKKDPTNSTWSTQGKLNEDQINELFPTGTNDYQDLHVFVVANPGNNVNPTKGQNVQQVLNVENGVDQYWKDGYFLMSGYSKKEGETTGGGTSQTEPIPFITKEKLLASTQANPFDLGQVKVYRAMARFDIATAIEGKEDPFKFYFQNGVAMTTAPTDENKADVTVEFVGASLVNMSYDFNLFKYLQKYSGETGSLTVTRTGTTVTRTLVEAGTATTPGVFDYFIDEYNDQATNFNYTNYVHDPYYNPAASLTKPTQKKSDLSYHFYNPVFDTPTSASASDPISPVTLSYMGLKSGFTGKTPTQDPDNDQDWAEKAKGSKYQFLTYSTPNTILTAANQVNGNSTGIVFKAEIKLSEDITYASPKKKVNGVETAEDAFPSTYDSKYKKVGSKLYAVGNVIYGTFEYIQACYNAGIADATVSRYYKAAYDYAYNKALTAAQTAKAESTPDSPTLTDEEIAAVVASDADIQAGMTKAQTGYANTGKFAAYAYEGTNENGGYYCYYYYWNRHNNNNDPEMGFMEFAVVRNNVYKLAIQTVGGLGHPGDVNDDPDPIDPNDPDEPKEGYFKLDVVVMPWTVRVNNVEF